MSNIKTYVRTALALITGERCVVCGAVLPGSGLCPRCLLQLPYLNIRGAAANPLERRFWGVVPVERASAMIAYKPGFAVEHLIHAIKYKDRSDLGVEMGRIMAQELLSTDFFAGIDHLQPVPLHRNRLRQRGYNQSVCLAQGISEVTGIPMGNYLSRTTDNVSQTHLTHQERRGNVASIFEGIPQHLLTERPQHILIVDDVITTGSTTISCGQTLVAAAEQVGLQVHLSFLSLAYAGPMHLGRLNLKEQNRPSYVINNEEFRSRQHAPLA